MYELAWIVLPIAGAAVVYGLVAARLSARRARGETHDRAAPAPTRGPPDRKDARRHPRMEIGDILALKISNRGKIRLLTQWRQDLMALEARRAHDAEVLEGIERALAALKRSESEGQPRSSAERAAQR